MSTLFLLCLENFRLRLPSDWNLNGKNTVQLGVWVMISTLCIRNKRVLTEPQDKGKLPIVFLQWSPALALWDGVMTAWLTRCYYYIIDSLWTVTIRSSKKQLRTSSGPECSLILKHCFQAEFWELMVDIRSLPEKVWSHSGYKNMVIVNLPHIYCTLPHSCIWLKIAKNTQRNTALWRMRERGRGWRTRCLEADWPLDRRCWFRRPPCKKIR